MMKCCLYGVVLTGYTFVSMTRLRYTLDCAPLLVKIRFWTGKRNHFRLNHFCYTTEENTLVMLPWQPISYGIFFMRVDGMASTNHILGFISISEILSCVCACFEILRLLCIY